MKEYRNNIVEEGWTEFLRGLSEYEKQFVIKEKENLLLDIYSEWLKTKEEKYKLKALYIASELEDLGVDIDINKMFFQEK
ncbi:MAG: hypothetical protein AB7E08_01955 [Candidatus Omnitrophota bacterium]